jgi:transposase
MATRPKGTHSHVVKAGKVRGQRRWLCRGCGYQFTRTTPRGKPLWHKPLAVLLYCHGLSINALSRMCGGRASSVLKWIRHYAIDHDEQPAPTGKAIVMEVDELWPFLTKNGTHAGSGTLVIALQASSLTGSVGVVIRPP